MRRDWRLALHDTETLIDTIYEAALLPDAWPRAIDAVSAAAGAAGGIVFAANSRFSGWTATESLRRTGELFIEQDWITRNARTPLIIARAQPGFLRDSDVFDDETLADDPMQKQLLVPAGLGREIATLIATPTGERIVFSMHRPLAMGRYDDRIVDRLDALRPHIARATLLSTRLGMERMQAAVAVLDAVGLAAAITGRRGQVMVSNRLFDAVPQIVPRAFSRIGLRSAGANRQLIQALDTIDRGLASADCSILLAGEPDAPGAPATPDAILHLVPLRRQARDLLLGAESVMIVTANGDSALPSFDLLQGLFDLSPGEARIARDIMSRSVGEIAAGASVSAETVRSQLKAVFRKTNTHKQSSLVALLTRLTFLDGNRSPETRKRPR